MRSSFQNNSGGVFCSYSSLLLRRSLSINPERSFRHLFHTVLQSEDDLHSVLSYDTLKAVVNVKELFISVVVSVDSRESKDNIVLSCDINNTASINYRSTVRKVVRHSNHKIRRDREPSRFQNHRIMEAM